MHQHPQNKINAEIQGVLLLDKPSGMTSQKALQMVKRSVGAHRAGHIGTLDPLASGLLPLMLGDATRYAFGWERADKIYTATIQLGGESSTDDSEGEIQSLPIARDINASLIAHALQQQVGEIDQLPPMYSAVRVDGKKLYQWARHHETKRLAGKSPQALPERPLRRVCINKINLLAWHEDKKSIDVEVFCGSGTFIRSIARDVGHALGTGGYITAIRRMGLGSRHINDSISWEQWLKHVEIGSWQSLLLPTECLVVDYPKVSLTEEQAYRLSCGQTLILVEQGHDLMAGKTFNRAFIPAGQKPFRLYYAEQFIGMGEIKQTEMGDVLHAGRMLPMFAPPKKPLTLKGTLNSLPDKVLMP